MKLHTFQELVSRIVHLSTRDGKPIPVIFSGTNAYTNTKSVNLPALPAGTILTPHQFYIWMGYNIHEGPGHQIHTDLPLYTHTCQQRNNPQFSYILNLLEDIRIENADINLYPGDRKYLDSVHHFVDTKIPPHLASHPDTMGLIYKHLFTHHRNLDTNIIHGNLDPATAKLISEIDHCHSTQDCITLADKVVNYLKQKQQLQKQNQSQNLDDEWNLPSFEEDEKDDKENQSNQNEAEDETQNPPKPDEETGTETNGNGTGSGVGNDSKDETETNSQNQSGSKENSNQGKESPNPTFDISNKSTTQWQEITEIKNIVQDLKNLIEKTPATPDSYGKSIFPPINISNDRIYVPSKEDIQKFNSTRTQCSSQILALKKMFRIYLQAKTSKSTIRGLEEGKLDTQRLHITATGSKTIFKDHSIKLLPETAIELMIDLSGSMNADIARTAAIILSEALNSIPQIKLSISGFTTNHQNHYYCNNISPNSGRHNGMDILQFKNFNESYIKCKAKLGAINNDGFTPLGDAYGHALEHLIPRPEPRRIIFLITDGQPEFTHGKNHSDYLLMQKIHHTAKRYNIQTLGLGIGRCEFLSKYFDQSINISQINDLPKNLLSALKFFI